MKRDKPGGGGTPGSTKAERPITSFFFKKPSPASTPAKPPVAETRDDTPVVVGSDAHLDAPAAKRRRDSIPVAGASIDAAPHHPETSRAPAPSAGSAAALEAALPPSRPERHDAFLLKLSRDPRRRDGTDRRGRDADDPSVDRDQPSGAAKMTPLEEQVRRHKADHPGVLLLIEVGYKFHFYGEDAAVASRVLNIFAYQSRNYLTASVPVARLHVYVRRLVEAGHKVGVIRQTETAALKAGGETDGGKSGLFERKLVGLYTRSTLEAGVAIAESGGTNDEGEFAAAADGRLSRYLLCIAEMPARATSATRAKMSGGARVRVGVAAVDASTGDVAHDEFVDGAMRPELEARLLRVAPAEVLLVEPVSAETAKLVAAMYGGGENGRGGVRVERVAAGSGYVDGGAAAAVAAAVAEWEAERARNRGAGETETETTLFSASPSLDLPAQSCRAVATAFDWLRQFGLDGMIRLAPAFRRMSECGEMRLTPNVLRQLEILQSAEGAHRGSLLWLMGSNAVTAAGGRLLRRWIAHPLTGRAAIEARLEAVAELRDEAEEGGGGALAGLVPALRASHGGAAGDAERYLARVFHGTATPAELVAALAAVRDFAASVNGMRRGAEFGAKLENTSSTPITQTPPDEFGKVAKATALRELLGEAADPAVSEVCRALLSAVDVEAARGGKATPATALLPNAERFPELERTRGAVADARRALDELLPALRQKLVDGAERCVAGAGAKGMSLAPRLAYVTVAQVEHLIELPDTLPGVPTTWTRVSTNKSKKVVRYHPPEVVEAAAALERARERHAAACGEAWRRFLRDDCAGEFVRLRAAVRAAAGLDALHSLAALARQDGYCRPTLLPDDDDAPATIRIRDGRHPILDATLAGGKSFVPNSVELRADGTRALVVTGPNMGGKSCFIRQTALACVMAQCGSFVPAASAQLTVLDGVYTRMGAADNLAMGASTFLEEMSECSAVLAAATPKSLVVLDELGRGTSTHDGVAVAHATLDHLVGAARCLALFVTHYPSVAREMRAKHPKHCAAAFTDYVRTNASGPTDATGSEEKRAGTDPDPDADADVDAVGGEIEFLYKLVPGVAHRSFGLNVARMAGLPRSLVRRAGVKAREMELATANRSATRAAKAPDARERAAEAKTRARAVLCALRGEGKSEDIAARLVECQKISREG